MRQRRSYAKEYKVQAVKLAKTRGTKAAAAELGIPEGSISPIWISAGRKKLSQRRLPMRLSKGAKRKLRKSRRDCSVTLSR
ncbi:MAG: hypothetical protein OSJ43_01395 [Oscillospiraceae bacterium]|nr:hypothetical protein [Oscillospiraceae bacterium]